MLVAVDGALALLVEIALLVGIVRAVLAVGPGGPAGPAGWALALLAAICVALVWGLFAAPASTHRLAQPALALLKAALYVLGAAAWWVAGPALAWAVFLCAGMLSIVLGLLIA